MESVLIIGVDTAAGANIAAMMSERHSVSGVARLPVRGWFKNLDVLAETTPAAVQEILRRRKPDRLIYCGSAAESCWSQLPDETEDLESLETWVREARVPQCGVTYLSSDAVFTGPWMFHAENSTSFCPSPRARQLREFESAVLAIRPDALIVRSHALGWSPTCDRPGRLTWLDEAVFSIESGRSWQADCVRHASPILATELAAVLQKSWSAGLTGIYHVAGAERVSPDQLLQRLRQHWQCPVVPRSASAALTEVATGFGSGETSLQTRKIRRALGISMPLLADTIGRLHDQAVGGFLARLRGETPQRRAA